MNETPVVRHIEADDPPFALTEDDGIWRYRCQHPEGLIRGVVTADTEDAARGQIAAMYPGARFDSPSRVG